MAALRVFQLDFASALVFPEGLERHGLALNLDQKLSLFLHEKREQLEILPSTRLSQTLAKIRAEFNSLTAYLAQLVLGSAPEIRVQRLIQQAAFVHLLATLLFDEIVEIDSHVNALDDEVYDSLTELIKLYATQARSLLQQAMRVYGWNEVADDCIVSMVCIESDIDTFTKLQEICERDYQKFVNPEACDLVRQLSGMYTHCG